MFTHYLPHNFWKSVKVACSDRDLKSYQVIASDKSNNLLRRLDFLLKSGFQVIAFFILLEVGYLVITVVNFVYK